MKLARSNRLEVSILRPSAWITIAALLAVFVQAPFFHAHSAEDSGTGQSLVHAHFPVPEEPPNSNALGSHHSHINARPFDVLSAAVVHTHQLDMLIIGTPVVCEVCRICTGFVACDAPSAHAPPVFRDSNPRSPPAKISSL
jgi:hypothetical protein